MIKSDYIYLLNIRLQELKEVYDKPFGGVCVLLMGDPMQLKPVMGSFCEQNQEQKWEEQNWAVQTFDLITYPISA